MKFRSKQEVRKYVWETLKDKGICLFPCENHIPNFIGVKNTIEKILNLKEYKKSERILISPDTPQRFLIKPALEDRKEVYMATPRLRRGFCLVKVYGNLREILKNCKIIGWDIPKIDLALIGSVAIDLKGNRIGKGGGFGDREIKIIRSNNPKAIVLTNIHELQLFPDLSNLMEKHDQKVNIIVTNTRIILTPNYKTRAGRDSNPRPTG